MQTMTIQVTNEGVLIPKIYLHNATEVEVVMTDQYVIIKPKQTATKQTTQQKKITNPATRARRFSFIGSSHTRNPQASLQAEEILEAEIDRRSGWSHNE